MAQKRNLSSGLDWMDVTQAVVNLEQVVGGKVTMELLTEMRAGSWDLVIRAHRARPPLGALDQPPLVSVSVSCRALRFVELEAACLSALNVLDVACFARNAYSSNDNKA